jgi:hypothetical protein
MIMGKRRTGFMAMATSTRKICHDYRPNNNTRKEWRG